MRGTLKMLTGLRLKDEGRFVGRPKAGTAEGWGGGCSGRVASAGLLERSITSLDTSFAGVKVRSVYDGGDRVPVCWEEMMSKSPSSKDSERSRGILAVVVDVVELPRGREMVVAWNRS